MPFSGRIAASALLSSLLLTGAVSAQAQDSTAAKELQRLQPRIIEWRRDLHEHPELGTHEVRTAKLVADQLRALGLQPRTGIAQTGVIAILICMVATLALWSSHTAAHLFWSWFILGGCFMVDSTVTLVRRVARGERFNEAHRSHAYQYAARRYASHKTVSIAFLVITAGWLFPLAVAVAAGRLDGLAGVAIGYAPLLVLAFRFKAGAAAEQEI